MLLQLSRALTEDFLGCGGFRFRKRCEPFDWNGRNTLQSALEQRSGFDGEIGDPSHDRAAHLKIAKAGARIAEFCETDFAFGQRVVFAFNDKMIVDETADAVGFPPNL